MALETKKKAARRGMEPGRRGVPWRQRSPILQQGLPPWRGRVLIAVVSLAFGTLLARAAWIQVFEHAFYAEEGRKRFERVLSMPAARGRILDRRGLPLAINRPLRDIYALPSAWAGPVDTPAVYALARLLDLDFDDVAGRLTGARGFVYLKRGVPMEAAAAVDALQLPAVRSMAAWRRAYPEGESMAQLIGFAGDGEQGQEGLEASLDGCLRPSPGKRLVVRNRLGEIVDAEVLEAPRSGADVRLTVDARLQQQVFRALGDAVAQHGARAAAAVVLDAATGEVLALANWPSFDPSNRAMRVGDTVRDRAVTDTFEPGSTIKPLLVADALRRGAVRSDAVVDTAPGWLKLGPFTVRDTVPRPRSTLTDILRYSSNVGMVKLTRDTAHALIWQALHDAGFGVAPTRMLPGVADGVLKDYRRWRPVDAAALSYGYGTAVSLLQLTRAYTMFGETGRVLPVHLVMTAAARIAEHEGRAGGDPVPTAADDARDASVAATVRKMLHAVTLPGGAGRRARVAGFDVGAKTGTTRQLVDGAYRAGRYFATTVGVVPLGRPRFVIGVVVDSPRGAQRGGGFVAAPVFSRIAAAALRLGGVAPDHLPPGAVSSD